MGRFGLFRCFRRRRDKKMREILNANINRLATGFITRFAAPPAFRPIAIAARLVAAFGFGRRGHGTLQHGGAGLSLNIGDRLGHVILWHNVRRRWRWQRRNLHNNPWAFTHSTKSMLRQRNEGSVNYLVGIVSLDKCQQNKAFSGVCMARYWL